MDSLLIGITLVVVLGVGAQYAAWRLRMPSILLLLLIGFIAGPVYGLIAGKPLLDPDAMFGELLFPLVSASVAVILFEGGLSLRFSELRKVGGAVINLITFGAIVTWGLTAAVAKNILGLKTDLALLLGAILIVTGPTVIGPLLRDVRPKGKTASILKWEGIVIDPIGAILAVLVFEVIAGGQLHDAPGLIAVGAARTFVIGGVVGAAGAGLMYLLLRRYWLPDYLQNPFSLMMVVGVFTVSNVAAHESGLVAVTVMGIVLANQKTVAVRHIVEFKENLRVLLISTLFILLAAHIKLAQFQKVGPAVVIFVLLLIAVVRPAAVFVATALSDLNLKEKLFLSWMAPRGIVAAAVSSIFALRLVELGRPEAEQLAPITFTVIVATVMVYGLTAGPVARRLGLSQERPQGLLILGATPFALALGEAARQAGFRVMVVDNDWFSVTAARMRGLPTFYGSILTECIMEEADLEGVGRLLALTSNDEVNSLAALHFVELFGRREVYQLPPDKQGHRCREAISPLHLRGRFLFGDTRSSVFLNTRIADGSVIKTTRLTEEFNYDRLVEQYSGDVIPLMLANEKKEIILYTVDSRPAAKPGHRVFYLVDPAKEEPAPLNGKKEENKS